MEKYAKNFKIETIADLKADLIKLEQDTSNLSLLLSLQFKLIKKVIKHERLVKALKVKSSLLKAEKRRGGIDKTKSNILKGNIDKIKSIVDNLKFKIHVLKMFGDGIAFIYIDKFDVKHLYYNVTDYSPKEQAGHLGGKEGLKEEWGLVKDACKNKIPALLNDITMSVRHGDVCLLGGSPPLIIEVKSSGNKNDRVDRQKRNLQRLGSFFYEDKAENFRNIPLVQRMEICIPEVTYVNEMNILLQQCREHGSSLIALENGFYVIAVSHGEIENELSRLNLKGNNVLPIFLNEHKNNLTWSPLTPYTLLIKDPLNLCDFINGHLTILCVLDLDCYKDVALKEGFELVFNYSGDYSLIFKEFDSEIIWGISRQVLLRTPLEMVSLSWTIKESIQRYRLMMDNQENTTYEDCGVNESFTMHSEFRHLFFK